MVREAFRCILAHSRRAAMCLWLRSGFCLATLTYRPDWCIAAEMAVLLEGSPLSTEVFWSSDRGDQVLGHLRTKEPFPPIAQFRRSASSGTWWFWTSPVYGWQRPLCSLGPSKQQNFSCTLPQICALRPCCFWGLPAVPLTSCLVCALTCTVNYRTICRQVCAIPNQVQSTEFTTSGLQLSCRNIPGMFSGNRMHLRSVLSFMAKAVNTCIHLISSFLFWINVQKSQTFCVWIDFEGKNYLPYFSHYSAH